MAETKPRLAEGLAKEAVPKPLILERCTAEVGQGIGTEGLRPSSGAHTRGFGHSPLDQLGVILRLLRRNGPRNEGSATGDRSPLDGAHEGTKTRRRRAAEINRMDGFRVHPRVIPRFCLDSRFPSRLRGFVRAAAGIPDCRDLASRRSPAPFHSTTYQDIPWGFTVTGTSTVSSRPTANSRLWPVASWNRAVCVRPV